MTVRRRFPSPVPERDLPKPLRKARGCVHAAFSAEDIGQYPLGTSTRSATAEHEARAQWVFAANAAWVSAVAHLLRWAAEPLSCDTCGRVGSNDLDDGECFVCRWQQGAFR